jgi:sarcosine oxidase delta subunit
MTKNIDCTACGRRIKIEGPTDGSREVSQPVTCPFCGTPNEVDWPMNAGYIVAPADGEEIR